MPAKGTFLPMNLVSTKPVETIVVQMVSNAVWKEFLDTFLKALQWDWSLFLT